MNYENMPRQELIMELEAWENKFKSELDCAVKEEKDNLNFEAAKLKKLSELTGRL